MCEDCGCGDPQMIPVEVHQSLLADNDRQAEHNRISFSQRGVTAINLMGSPGGEVGRSENEGPEHTVRINRPSHGMANLSRSTARRASWVRIAILYAPAAANTPRTIHQP